MIIECDQCLKKFEIESSLIPQKGRLLQCSSCDNKWFYKKILKQENIVSLKKEKIKVEKKQITPNQQKRKIIQKDDFKSLKPTNNKKNIKIKKISFLNIILIFIISVVALILVAETFKVPFAKLIPSIEFILENLYETLRDLILFIKDLF